MSMTVNVSAPNALKKSTITVTAKVKVTGLWRVRLGLRLIKLGARIAGIGRVETGE